MVGYNLIIISDYHESARAYAALCDLRGIRCAIVGFQNHDLEPRVNDSYDLAMIDANGSQTEALAICRYIRARFTKPLLLLTYERDERYHIQSYKSGVDECINKSIDVELLLAKITVWLNRARTAGAKKRLTDQFGFRLNVANRHIITPEGRSTRLSKLECELMHLFLNNEGRILEINDIINRIWTFNGFDDDSLVKNLIYRLRRKIESEPANPKYIQTVPGQGYAFWGD